MGYNRHIFSVNDKDRIVGIIDFRHTLNDFLTNLGNCGYSVRPSERGKGFAAEKKNEPSVKTITQNGGVYERSFEFVGERVKCVCCTTFSFAVLQQAVLYRFHHRSLEEF